jgi:hypothetical protein
MAKCPEIHLICSCISAKYSEFEASDIEKYHYDVGRILGL